MAHEITSTDGLVLHRVAAWHGLGTIVEQAPTPAAALQLAGLDWAVDQWPLVAVNEGGERMPITSHVANIRRDTRAQLGIVGKGYKPAQNQELADFAEALAKEGDIVRCESAGSIRGGAKVWFLLKGESFSVRAEADKVVPYICLSNGHDGVTAIRATPTTVRVVCSNTLHQVIPATDAEGRMKKAKSAFVVFHTGDLAAKLDACRAALKLYEHSLTATKTAMNSLASKDVTREQIQDFWLAIYQRQFGEVMANPATEAEQKAHDRATEAVGTVARNFDTDLKLTGATAWGAFNAYTHWLQHDRNIRAKDEATRTERRTGEALLGIASERSSQAFDAALALV